MNRINDEELIHSLIVMAGKDPEDEEVLMHYGVKGMKWDESKRKFQDRMDYLKGRAAINKRKLKYNLTEEAWKRRALNALEKKAGKSYERAAKYEAKRRGLHLTEEGKAHYRNLGEGQVRKIKKEYADARRYAGWDEKLKNAKPAASAPGWEEPPRRKGRRA